MSCIVDGAACFQQCERDARVKLPVKAQIVKPAQRIPRYELLLKVIILQSDFFSVFPFINLAMFILYK